METEGVFDSRLLDSAGYPLPPETMEDFLDNPMAAILQPLIQYFEAIKPNKFEPVATEHKVRIYQLVAEYNLETLERIAAEMEGLLNEGYCCHMPTVVNDYVIMDFSRRKENKNNEQ